MQIIRLQAAWESPKKAGRWDCGQVGNVIDYGAFFRFCSDGAAAFEGARCWGFTPTYASAWSIRKRLGCVGSRSAT